MKKKIIIGLLIIISVIVLISYFSLKQGFVIRISEKEIQDAVAVRFPIEKTHIAILNVKYSDPLIELLEGKNRVRIGITATPQIMVGGKTHSGSAVVNGSFRYEAGTGKVFLTDFKVEKIVIDESKKLNLDLLSIALSYELDDIYSVYPIYTLSDTDFKQKTAKMVVKDITVENNNLEIHFGL